MSTRVDKGVVSFVGLPNMKTYNPVLVDRARRMRHAMTEAECRIWFEVLQKMQPRIRRQRPIGRFIVDFYCAARKLVIEIDGESHNSEEALAYDQERTAFLQAQGLTVLRFTNSEVMSHLEGVHEMVTDAMYEVADSIRSAVTPLSLRDIPPIA